MARVVHFELPSKEPEAAIEFYKKVFDWKIERWEDSDYWMITTGEDSDRGINGSIVPKATDGSIENSIVVIDASHAVNATVTVGVENVEETSKKVEEAGGRIVMPKWKIEKIGLMIYFQDLDGNLLGALQPTDM